MYYVYLIQSRINGQFYIGYTDNLRRRIDEHNTGKSLATKAYVPYELIYYEAYKAKEDAMARERALKHYGNGIRRLKERLLRSMIDFSK